MSIQHKKEYIIHKNGIFFIIIIIISLFWKHRTRQCQKIQKNSMNNKNICSKGQNCLLYTSPSPRD